MSAYRLTGRIITLEGKPLSRLTVRVHNLDPRSPDVFLTEALTNDDGRYSMLIDELQVKPRATERGGLDVYIRVFKGDALLGQSEVRRIGGQRVAISMRVDPSKTIAPQVPTFMVSGVVRHADGRPVVKAMVRAVHQRLRGEDSLGKEQLTDTAGRYAIAYTAADLGDMGLANLRVRVFSESDDVLAQSAVLFQARAREHLDLTVQRPEDTRSRHERLLQQLDPLLDGAVLADLGENEVVFLAGASGLTAEQIKRLVLAERAASFASLPAAAFHGFLEAYESGQQGTLARFWARLADDFGIPAEEMPRFRFLAQAGEMVAFDAPLMEALLARWKGEEIFSALDLALWDETQWLTLLKTAWNKETSLLPSWARGQDRDAQLSQAFASIRQRASRLFPAKTVSRLQVSGRVHTPSKRPAVGVMVQAVHVDLDREIAISPKVLSDGAGCYHMVIDPDGLGQRVPSLGRIPLQLRLLAWVVDEEAPVVHTEIIAGANLPLTLDITVPREVGPTEFELLSSRLCQVLGSAEAIPDASDNLAWLAGATGLDMATVEHYVKAHVLTQNAEIPAEALYGLLHPATEPEKHTDEATAEARLQRAVAAGLVRPHVLEHISAVETWVQQREQEAKRREFEARVAALRKPTPAGLPSRPVDILRGAGVPERSLDAFIRLAAEYPEEDAWILQQKLPEEDVPDAERAAVRTALRLAELVGADAALVGSLVQKLPSRAGAFDETDEDADIAPLALWSALQWGNEIKAHHPDLAAADIAQRVEEIEATLEVTYPIEALLGRLEERVGSPDEDGDPEDRQATEADVPGLLRTLKSQQDINLRGKSLKFQNLSNVPKSVQHELENLQRLARIASFREAITLLEMGYMAAREIAVTPAESFGQAFVRASRPTSAGGYLWDEAEALRRAHVIHRRAEYQVAAALATTSGLSPMLWGTNPAAVGGAGMRPEGSTNATLETLFGRFDACSVAPCESVLGLPAYLVDLLELLEKAGDTRHPDPRNELERRRPDIFHLELSCANAETLLPTIDLVIELLEDRVAPPVRRPATVPAIGSGLGQLIPLLSADLTQQHPAPNPIRHHRQTTWSGEELQAYPEHLNAEAYAKLKSEEALFPWRLPFSLAHEEAETYLEDLGTCRHELMWHLRPAPVAGQATIELSSAYLALHPAARRIILGEVPTSHPWRCWGYAAEPAGWPGSVGKDVKALLERTGLSYADLIELLATRYINPDRNVALELEMGVDACDLSRASLKNVDESFLNRFHRFTRLWLHLGCSVRELDRAVVILGDQDITKDFLIKLADARRLASRLRLSLAAVLPFWGDIDTEASLDRAAEPITRRPSQYEVILLDKSRLSAVERQRLAFPFATNTALDTLYEPVSTALGLDAADRVLLTTANQALCLSQPAVAANAPLPMISALYRWQTLAQALALPIRDLLRLRALSGIDPFASPAACLDLLDAWETLQHHGMSIDELDWPLRHVSSPERLSHFEDESRRLLLRVRENLLKQGAQVTDARFAEADVEAVLCREVAHLCRLSNGAVATILSQIEVSDATPKTGLAQLAGWLVSANPDQPSLTGPAWVAYVRLVKSARLYARMNLGEQVLHSPADAALSPLVVFSPNALPHAANRTRTVADRRRLFDAWLALASLAELQQRLAAKRLSLWGVHEVVTGVGGLLESWQKVDLQMADSSIDVATLIGQTLLALHTPAADAAPAAWLRFLDATMLVRQLGVPVGSLVRWVADDMNLNTSAEMRAAAAARKAPEDWRARAPQLRQGLRVKQRAALLAWARGNPLVADLNELHAEYLIDLETGPGQLTTRIGLAVAAVQRFVQRSLLGIERAHDDRPVVLPPRFADTWEWMKSYQAWANARKVFLFPENFLTPEIRDDKSQFFVEFEQQLSQHTLNDETIEDAVGQYLQKLDEVARLEIMGSCTEERDGERLLHIVARSRGVPRSYFHRTWYIGGGGFTPWVKLDLEIDGDWVIPVVFNGRLTLYWVKHTQQLEGMADVVGKIPTRPFPLSPHYPMPQDQYTLSWSTQQRKGWSKKRIAERPIARPLNPLIPAQFAVRLDPDRLRIAGVSLLPQLPSAPGWTSKPSFGPNGPVFDDAGGAVKGILNFPTSIPPGIDLDLQSIYEKILQGIYKFGDWVWEQVDGVWQWVRDTAEDLAPPPEELEELVVDFPDNMLDTLKKMLKLLASFKNDIVEKLINLPREVWNQLDDRLQDFRDAAWNLLPDSIQAILKLIKSQIDDVVAILTNPNIQDAPQRLLRSLISGADQYVASIATIVGEFLRLVTEAGLTKILGDGLIGVITQWFDQVQQSRPGWAGPLPGFEFGFFDVGEGGARALRLTPPPFLLAQGILAGGALAVGVAAAPLAASLAPLLLIPLSPVLFTAAPLLVTGLIAMSESARLIYSMFPGYPAFHDIPVLSGVLSTDLPVMTGSSYIDDRIRAWPGSGFGFLVTGGNTLGLGRYCTIAVNLQTIALEEVQDLEFPLARDFTPTLGAVKDIANNATNFLEMLSDKLDDLGSLLNVGMRVVRPLPFGAYPARLYKPPPTIIGEDRHSRNFLLHQGVENRGKRETRTWHVVSLYHPLSSMLSRSFDREGVPGLYESASRPTGEAWSYGEQNSAKEVFTNTFWVINPLGGNPVTAGAASHERLDLSPGGAYSLYNWELLFHIPMLIAGRLARQQSFAQALGWYSRVFDPTVAAGTSPQRFWRFKQFHDDYANAQPYQTLVAWLTGLAEGSVDDEQAQVVAAWRRDPFNAHLVARMRAGTYPRWVVMRTVETLVTWGDARFREGSWEAVNEATQLYLMAQEILGPRPQLVPARHAEALTYQQLADRQRPHSDGIDPFGNALLAIEAAHSPLDILDGDARNADPSLAVLSGVSMLYFGIPANERLLALWDTIDDRMLKIRRGLDDKGRLRTLPTLGWGAAGENLSRSRLAEQMTSQPQTVATRVPPYRFHFMLQKAHEFVGEVKAFGAALLAASEKRDAEELARLRAGHEVNLVEAMRRIRELQIAEAEYAVAAARKAGEGAKIRFNYYSSREFISPAEIVKDVLMGLSLGFNTAAATGDAIAALLTLSPQVKIEGSGGTDTSVKAAGDTGGIQLGGAASATARVFSALSSVAQAGSSMAGTIASYQRRQEEWNHQAQLAENDLAQFEEQIAAANARLSLAQHELENQTLQLANAREISDYLHDKFTNQELYEWMLEQAAMLHFQSYLLAVDVARQVESSFHYERMPMDKSFLAIEQWNDLGGALLAGERLQHDLRRMEKSFLDLNTRDIEITKNISLALIDPVALLRLRQSGECFVSLPEYLFDEDHPGHFLRRIKAISLSIPSVVGPYVSVNCRLSLVRSEVRVSPDVGGTYPRMRGNNGPDERFKDVNAEGIEDGNFTLSAQVAAIVTSHAQGDSGLFEMNLRDERYLPFEGAGAISTWRIELPKETNRFDLATVSDLVMHFRYTARDGGTALRSKAWEATFGSQAPANLPLDQPVEFGAPRKLMRLFSARDDFASAWDRFLHPADTQDSPSLELDLTRGRFPYQAPELNLVLKSFIFIFITEPSASAEDLKASLSFLNTDGSASEAAPTNPTFTGDPALSSLATCKYVPAATVGLGLWRFEVGASDNMRSNTSVLNVDNANRAPQVRLDSKKVINLFVLCEYELEGSS
jgi:hypothetical protein